MSFMPNERACISISYFATWYWKYLKQNLGKNSLELTRFTVYSILYRTVLLLDYLPSFCFSTFLILKIHAVMLNSRLQFIR